MEYEYIKWKLKLKESRKDFDSDLDWLLHKQQVVKEYQERRKREGRIYRDNFHRIHDLRDYKAYFKKGRFRKIILLEKLCDYYRLIGKLPEHPTLCLEDFIIHLHWFSDTFNKGPLEIKKDIATLDEQTKQDILDSILYKDVYIGYVYKMSPKFNSYLRNNNIYLENRHTHRPKKKVEGFSTKYFNNSEKEILKHDGYIGVIRDRVQWYKTYYEQMRQIKEVA